MTLAPFR